MLSSSRFTKNVTPIFADPSKSFATTKKKKKNAPKNVHVLISLSCLSFAEWWIWDLQNTRASVSFWVY